MDEAWEAKPDLEGEATEGMLRPVGESIGWLVAEDVASECDPKAESEWALPSDGV